MDHESQNTDLLYDYFYLDSERIKFLISQLNNGGIQISFKTVKSSSDKSSQNASAKIPFVQAGLSSEDSASKSSEKSFDSTFSHPLNLLSVLQEQGMLKNSLSECNLGDIVVINGAMGVFDTKMVVDAFPFIKKIMGTAIKEKGKKPDKDTQNTLKHSTDILSLLPTSTQIDFKDTENNAVWMSVNAQNLSINTGDIVLKYGSSIPGSWYVLGVVDAKPDEQQIDDNTDHIVGSGLKSGFSQMFDIIKTIAGRPCNAYGMTPVIIFRSIS